MNIQTTNRLTPAETALVEAFTAKFTELPGNGDVVAARDVLFDDLKTAGLPTRRIEAWHYTDMKTLLRSIPEDASAPVIEKRDSAVAGSQVAYLRHGKSADTEIVDFEIASFAESLLDGTAAGSLVAADKDDMIGRLNGSFVRDGYSVTVPDEAQIERPLELQVIHGAGQVHTRSPVRFGKGSKATIIERHLSVAAEAALVTHVTDLEVQDGRKPPISFCSSRVQPIRIWLSCASSLAQTPIFVSSSSMQAASSCARNCALMWRVRAPISPCVASTCWAAKPTRM